MSRLSGEDQEKRDAEQGFVVRGEKEVRLREWFSLHEAGEKAGDFDKRVAVLRAKKWAKEHPERRKAIALRYMHKPEVKARQLKQQKARRHDRIKAGAVYTCQWKRCGVQWCQLPWAAKGPRKLYCCDSHSSMAYADRKKSGKPRTAHVYRCGLCGGNGHARTTCQVGGGS